MKFDELPLDVRKRLLMLEALEAAGVDNWDWYGEAMQDYRAKLAEAGIEDDDY